MSTRGATGFIANGKWYVTYNHGDSYPSYLGMRVLEFCKTIKDFQALKERVKELTLVNSDTRPSGKEINACKKYADLSVSTQSLSDWYCLLRNVQGAEGLYEIASGDLKYMIDSVLFLADGLFCEWAYIIDLDNLTLKTYKGFQKKEPVGTPLPDCIKTSDCNDGYYPVKMLYEYNLDKLPEFVLGVTNEFKKAYRAKQAQLKQLDK